MFGNVEDTLRHLAVLAYPNDPSEITFKDFDLVIWQTDTFRNFSKHDKR